MKKAIPLILIILMICPAAVMATESLTPGDFRYCDDLDGRILSNTIYQVQLPPEILQKCADGYNDLRLFGSANREVPYVIIENEYPDEVIETFLFQVVDYKDDRTSTVITMKLPEKYQPVSVIEIDTADRDFKKDLMLYGSHDMKKWDLLVKDAIYDFSSQVALRKTEIKFTKADYRYFRIKLIDARSDAKAGRSIQLKYNGLDFSTNNISAKRLHINKITGLTGAKTDRIRVYDEEEFTGFPVNLDKDRNTIITVEADLPFDKVYFDVSNPYYYRELSIYHSDSGKADSYILLTRSSIYSFPLSGISETRNYVAYTSIKHKYYKIVIENKNNPPLEIRNIIFRWIQKDLYFVSLKETATYSLCFGNSLIKKPDYDLSNFINQNNWFKQRYEKLTTGQIKTNAGFRQKIPEDKKKKIEKIILTAVVVSLVIGIGFWLYSLIRKADNP